MSNVELLDALAARNARTFRVPVYRWALPEDVTPLRQRVSAIIDDRVDVATITWAPEQASLGRSVMRATTSSSLISCVRV